MTEIQRRIGFIYFAESGDLIKIGWSIDPIERMKDLISPREKPIKLLGVIGEKHSLDEWHIHNALKKFRVEGEWFKRTPEIMKVIDLFAKPPVVVNAYARSDKTFITFPIPKTSKKRLKQMAVDNRITLQGLICGLIEEYFQREEAQAA